MLRIVIRGVRRLLEAFVTSAIRENLRIEKNVCKLWLRRILNKHSCLSSACMAPKVAFFLAATIARDSFLERVM